MPKQNKNAERDRPVAEPWEVEYAHQQLPTHSEDELSRLTGDCKKELRGSTDRKKLINCVRKKVS